MDREMRKPRALLYAHYSRGELWTAGSYSGSLYLGGKLIPGAQPLEGAPKLSVVVLSLSDGRKLTLFREPIQLRRDDDWTRLFGWCEGRNSDREMLWLSRPLRYEGSALPLLCTYFEPDGRRVRVYPWVNGWERFIPKPVARRLDDGRPDEIRLLDPESVGPGQEIAWRFPFVSVSRVWQAACGGISSGDISIPAERPVGREWEYAIWRPLRALRGLNKTQWARFLRAACGRYFEEVFLPAFDLAGETPKEVINPEVWKPLPRHHVSPALRYWSGVRSLLHERREMADSYVAELRRAPQEPALWLAQRGKSGAVMVFADRAFACLLAFGSAELDALRERSLLELTGLANGQARLAALLKLGVRQILQAGLRT